MAPRADHGRGFPDSRWSSPVRWPSADQARCTRLPKRRLLSPELRSEITRAVRFHHGLTAELRYFNPTKWRDGLLLNVSCRCAIAALLDYRCRKHLRIMVFCVSSQSIALSLTMRFHGALIHLNDAGPGDQ